MTLKTSDSTCIGASEFEVLQAYTTGIPFFQRGCHLNAGLGSGPGTDRVTGVGVYLFAKNAVLWLGLGLGTGFVSGRTPDATSGCLTFHTRNNNFFKCENHIFSFINQRKT